LDGELGSGKTVFVSGLAAGIGIKEPVLSPSFTIVKEYGGSRYNLYHIDLYRLSSPSDLMSFDFYEYAGREASITAIEWANKFGETFFFPKVPTIFVNFKNIEELSETDYLRSIDLKFENFSDARIEKLLEEL
ncbi:MAG TPA: tRNA (adenosine(37)-N6)-threonylcarbamoyltransferase complex ATPase subunit type 1 TsaE, partial [Candidatus Wallbacteria bacterium]|nr:tRNA (adenosine(37)-N6)-threonylcarbamoyltransferase complex ATPase subunit type 1 TsaE [Candidatus Wallbacteria bacterium]